MSLKNFAISYSIKVAIVFKRWMFLFLREVAIPAHTHAGALGRIDGAKVLSRNVPSHKIERCGDLENPGYFLWGNHVLGNWLGRRHRQLLFTPYF